MSSIKRLFNLLTAQERRKSKLLFLMIVAMALLDVMGVASIMPFIAVLATPSLVQSNSVLYRLYLGLNFSSTENFLLALGALVFLTLVVSLAFKAWTTYTLYRFTRMLEYSIGKRLVASYLNQPYIWLIGRHSADLAKTVLSEVSVVIDNGLMPLMTLATQSVVALTLLFLLVVVDPLLAILIAGVLGVAYLFVFKHISNLLTKIGINCVSTNQARFTAVSEAFGAVKEVKASGLEQVYIKRFAIPAEAYARHNATAQVLAVMPRFALEAIAFGGMILVMLALIANRGSFASALPVVSLYAFAGYRLMPALQQIYSSSSQIRFVGPALNSLHDDLMTLSLDESLNKTEKLSFAHGISLANVSFSYPEALKPALNCINIIIPARSTIGVVGSTGSGKTTLIDLILGLLEPQLGAMLVGGERVTKRNIHQWQQMVGYVPQQIYLADDTVAANIAFGFDPVCADQRAVEKAATIANLHQFVVDELPLGYATMIGERGVRLSGGQRQRIGIARALYANPHVLILDEATSALDTLTEQAVMEAVNNIGHDITIIMIAHRLSTVRQCDQIYLLENGSIKASGTYDELIKKNAQFNAMAEKSSDVA